MKFKKVLIGILGIACGSSAFSGMFQPIQEISDWGYGGQALVLQPDFSNYNFIGDRTTAAANINDRDFVAKDFKYNWGFKVEAFKHFGGSLDTNLNWYHTGNQYSQNLPSGTNVWGSSFGGTVATTLKPQWNAINLEVAKTFSFDESGKVRVFTGLQYADIRLEEITTGTSRTVASTIRRQTNTKFQGGGLRAGADVSYAWKKGLSFYANMGAAFLSGRHNFNRDSQQVQGAGILLQNSSGAANSTIEEFEGKLGVSYQTKLKKSCCDLVLDMGWMWVNYFDAVVHGDEGVAGGRTYVSDFSQQGLYVGAKIKY
jgi:hypothetical protein